MLLGFKERFASFVEAGSKTHTIRARRKIPARVGEICHCYYALRTKKCRLLGRFECVAVQDIVIGPVRHGQAIADVWLDGTTLDLQELNLLAWRDGFRGRGRNGAWAEMFEYWTVPTGRSTDPPALPFEGHVIHWRFK